MKINEITKELTPLNNVRFAIFCAEQVLPIFEEKFPHNNNNPRKSVNAAISYVLNPSHESSIAAHYASEVAATNNSASVNTKEAYAAYAASEAAYAVATPTVSATAAARCALQANPKVEQAIVNYGILLIDNQ